MNYKFSGLIGESAAKLGEFLSNRKDFDLLGRKVDINHRE